MTLPPPAFAGLQTGNRGTRRRAPVSDRPGAGLAAAGPSLPLPLQGVELSLALPEALFFTGIDWAAATHAVCVMDAAGKIIAEFTIEHSADGIATLVRRLARYGEPASIPVAIERPNGRLVDLLLEAGHPVVPVSPNAIKTWRGGGELSAPKSDSGVVVFSSRRRHTRFSRDWSSDVCS